MDEEELKKRLKVLLGACQRANLAADPRPMLGLVTREVAALAALFEPPRIVGESARIRQVRQTIENIRASSASVLITGEPGTGKELAAATIHHSSLRARGPFVPAGHGDGLRGLLRTARGGAIFIREVTNLDDAAQREVLRSLDDEEIEVRFLAASARDLEAEAARGSFRADLYYRLKVIHIALPPLREIAEDIPLLANHFLAELGARRRCEWLEFPAAILEGFARRPWPGNIGQLQAEVRRLATGETLRQAVASLEKKMVEDALEAAHQNQSHAAKALGLSRQGLLNKMRRYAL
jgi:DNA-binding NtrC family response regulator